MRRIRSSISPFSRTLISSGGGSPPRLTSRTSKGWPATARASEDASIQSGARSEEHTSELQSRLHLVCRLLLEKKKDKTGVRRLMNALGYSLQGMDSAIRHEDS